MSIWGGRHVSCNPGGAKGVPVYKTHRDIRNEMGRRLEFVQVADDLLITSVYQFFDGIPGGGRGKLGHCDS